MSELVGFALSFSIIVGAVGVVYVAGFGTLEDVRDQSDVQSADRGMQGVAVTFEEIQSEGVPGRSLELDADGGALRTLDGRVFVNVSTESSTVNETVDLGGLAFVPTGGPTRFVYQGGALFRTQREATLVRHRPRLTCEADTALVSLVEVRPERGPLDLTAAGTVEIVGRRVGSSLRFPDVGRGQSAADGRNVTINVSASGQTEGWEEYFETADGWRQVDDTYVCQDVDRVQVRVTEIEIRTIY